MVTELNSAVVGAAADVGNRSPGQLAMEQLSVSVPATNRLTPSSWVTEKVSATVSVNVNRKTVANAKTAWLRGLVRHAPVQVDGVGARGVSEAKKPGIRHRFERKDLPTWVIISRFHIMPTNRVRTRRNTYTAVSSEAVELYRRAKNLQAKGFERSSEYAELAFKLNIELRMKPWMPSVLHSISDTPPSDVPKNLQHYHHSARDLQRSLDAAAAAITTPLPRSPRVVEFPEQPTP